MKHRLFLILVALAVCSFPIAAGAVTYDTALATRMQGRILLQVESHGEAWYVRSKDLKRYYMKDGAAAYSIMRFFSQGITDADLAKIPSVSDTTAMKASSSICTSNALANRMRGEILLQVQQHGEAWYVDPVKCRAIYMKDGAVAYEVMRFLGLGILTGDLEKIQDGGTAGGDSGAASQPAASPVPDVSCVGPTDTAHMDIFDSHAHMPSTISASQIISEMDKAGVSMTNLYTDSTSALGATSQYPGRFITFVDPSDSPQPSTWLAQGQTFFNYAESELKTGKFYGIGEANLRYYSGDVTPPPTIDVPADTPLWLQLVDLSAQYHVPISFHFVPDDAVANAAFERMLSHNKDATLIWAHLGFNNLPLDSAKLSDYLLRYPHLYLDTAGIQNMQNTPPQSNSNWALLADQSNNGRLKAEWKKFFETWNSRILFGSDAGGGSNGLERWLNYAGNTSQGATGDAVGHWKSLFSTLDSNAALNILSGNSKELFLKKQKPAYAYSVASGGACQSVSVRSESSISALAYDSSARMITFTAADSAGTTGHAVITIPTALAGGKFAVSVDGKSVTSQATSNVTSTTVTVEYSGGVKMITITASGTP